jgi:hypothetical protein
MDQYSAKSKSYSQELGKINKNTTQSVCLGFCVLFFFGISLLLHQDSGIVFDFCCFIFYRLYSFNANSLQVAFERKINTALKEINENEISYLEKKTIPFENGLEFNDFHHPYAYDLDIFGEHSLSKLKYRHFYRKKNLAEQLLTLSQIKSLTIRRPSKGFLEN